jgi:hypothetical protein
MRHLFSTNQRRALLGHLDTLLDERVLLGNGVAAREFLRRVFQLRVIGLNITGLPLGLMDTTLLWTSSITFEATWNQNNWLVLPFCTWG